MIPPYGTRAWDRLWRRFWRRVRMTDDGGCWVWGGKVQKSTGYGRVVVGGKDRRAHRVAYQLAIGPIPLDRRNRTFVICHRCDNPLCVRPSHLYADTQRENMRDMVGKGRDWFSKYRRDSVTEARHARSFEILTEGIVA